MKSTSHEENLSIVAIVGMGGLGKTTLVAPLFGLTRLEGPNRFRDAVIPLYHFIKIIYQKHTEVLHFSWHKNPFQICGPAFKGVGPLTFHLYQSTVTIKAYCDAPKPGCPLTTRQPAEYSWMSGNPTPLMKIGQSLLCTGSSTQGIKLVPTIYNDHTWSTCE